MTKNKPKAIDLFAGIGGFSLGIKRSGFNVIVAVEFDKHSAHTYKLNHHNTIVIEEDIRNITARRLMKTAGVKRSELDMLFGSPPCQGFSTISKTRSINDPRSKLMYEFVRIVKGVQPKFFCIENVPGLLYFKDFFILLMKALEKCGYVVRCLMMDSASYGVPQYRKRVFIQGARKDLKIVPTFLVPTHFDSEMNRKAIRKGQQILPSALVDGCFAVNGFSKEEVKDLYWNKTLHIQMNRNTSSYIFEMALDKLIGNWIERCSQNDHRRIKKSSH